MIPKIIHYCWFGEKPIDELAQKCINSWRAFFPDYSIIQWNEKNFDITQIMFAKEAYKAEKWAFVSDVVRLAVVYQYGGLYFDTDVEIMRDYSDIIDEKTECYFGFEQTGMIASGLGFGAVKEHPFIKQNLEEYRHISFNENINALSKISCPIITTRLLSEMGLKPNEGKQKINGIDIYPSDYFSPINYYTGKLKISKHTHSIHWYNASWQDEEIRRQFDVERKYRRIFGIDLGDLIYGVVFAIKNNGLKKYIKKHLSK